MVNWIHSVVFTHLFVGLSVVNSHTLDLWTSEATLTLFTSEPRHGVNASYTSKTWVELALQIKTLHFTSIKNTEGVTTFPSNHRRITLNPILFKRETTFVIKAEFQTLIIICFWTSFIAHHSDVFSLSSSNGKQDNSLKVFLFSHNCKM